MKILVIRFSSIGDIVLTTPIIRSLKANYPTAEIHFLTKKRFQGLLEFHSAISEIHCFEEDMDRLESIFNPEEDYIVDLHKNLRSKSVRKSLGGKQFEYQKINIQKWLFSALKINKLPNKHLIDRYFDGLTELELKYDQQGLDFPINPATTLSKHDLPENYYVFAIGGTYPTKRLPNDKIVAIAEKLNAPLILIGGSDDETNAIQIQEACSKQIINLCGKLSIHESALLMKGCMTVFCHDSGMMHIAAALNIPIRLIWGNTHPSFGMYPFLKANTESQVRQYEVDVWCRPCSKLGYKSCPMGHFKCMNKQNVEEIVKNIDSIESVQ